MNKLNKIILSLINEFLWLGAALIIGNIIDENTKIPDVLMLVIACILGIIAGIIIIIFHIAIWYHNLSWLGYLNFILFQWFFIRLACTGEIEKINDFKYLLKGHKLKIIKWIIPLTGWWNEFIYIKDLFCDIGMGVWLVDNKIIGWKVSCNHIVNPYNYNTINWFPFQDFDKFYKINLVVPGFLYNFIFKNISKLWFKNWKIHEKFKGFKPY